MSNRFNNKRLLLLLSGLIVILLLTVVVKIPKERATLKSNIVEFDTAEVNKIILYPRISRGKAIEFNKENGKWNVRQDNIVSSTQEGAVQNLLNDVLSMKPQSLAAVNKSKWNEFEISDSLATRIKILNNKGKTVADLMIGKLNFRQQDNPYAGSGGNNVQATSYVRLYSEQKVYTVDGLSSLSFNVKFDSWRDKTFIKSNKNDITGIHFIYPADSSFNLNKKDNIWRIADQLADSAAVANYLAEIGLMNGVAFRDNYKPVLSPVYQLSVEGNNLLNFSVKCFKEEGTDEYILNSSLNPEVYFTTKKNGLFDKLFKSKSHFLTEGKKH